MQGHAKSGRGSLCTIVSISGLTSSSYQAHAEYSNKLISMHIGPSVVFMLKHLKQNGCDVTPEHIVCAPCDFTRSGGFVPEAGAVMLCQGRFFNKRNMEDTLVHELVHMYDHCKFKVDWSNLRHHACSEVSFPEVSFVHATDTLHPGDSREQP